MLTTRRTTLALVLAGTMLLTAGSAFAKDKYKIAVMPYGEANEYMKAWTSEIQNHPAVKAGDAVVTILDGKFDPLVQQNQIESVITQKYDAVVIAPFDLTASAAPIDSAVNAGIPVIASALKTASTKVTASIIVDDKQGGFILGDTIGKQLGGKGNIVIMEGPIGQSAQIERRAGIDEGLKKYPGIKVLAAKSGNWSRAEGQSLMENWLLAYKGQINGLLAENDEMALGAVQAMKSAGIDFKTVPVMAIDGIPDAKRAVASGEMALSLYKYAKAEGQGAIDLAMHALNSDYKPKSEIWTSLMKWDDGKDKAYVVPWLVLTKENVAQYMN